jgi:PPK2 family polyphosphate:nucleotide phosphotransferase
MNSMSVSSPVMDIRELLKPLLVPPGKKISLEEDYDPGYVPKQLDRQRAEDLTGLGSKMLAEYQDKLYAQNTHALLVVFQAIDAAGKDGAIKHVMSGVNPQGCQVFSFKSPSDEELDHDYLWRCFKALPERGRIGIFNRSYYEEVVVVRVHPEFLERQQLPRALKDNKIWDRRFDEINSFERYLTSNAIHVLKIFLNLSKEVQRERFLKRLNRPDKNWKFSLSDVKERELWDDYRAADEDMLNHTSTRWAPWYVVPADHKWYSRLCVAALIVDKLQSFELRYPTIGEHQKQQLESARKLLESETEPKKRRAG